ncbi:MAG: hypothetical protein ACXW1D_00825 [Halobacteriota archaeon]
MNIGLDYDDTYTRDPIAWDTFIKLMCSRGHYVYIVTWRFEDETELNIDILNNETDGVYFTGRRAKEKFMYERGIRIDVWIDDNPRAITTSMEGY